MPSSDISQTFLARKWPNKDVLFESPSTLGPCQLYILAEIERTNELLERIWRALDCTSDEYNEESE